MTEFAKGYSRDAALRFPFLPEEHETAWRYVFDWAVCGEALGCAPGDLVLEFAAGPGYATELFNRLGYRTVALDVNPEILVYARERLVVDARLDPARAAFVSGDGERLPFRDASFDGLVCLNALHHMPDYRNALAEMRRILKPGARAVFSEPGRTHADAAESKLAMEQYGALEKSVYLDEVYRLAREVGFERMILKPFVYPELVELDYREFGRYRFHLSSSPLTRPDQIARFFVDFHTLFALAVPGQRPLTSVRPRAQGGLKASLSVEGAPSSAAPGDLITARVAVQNRGPHVWLSAPRPFGGRVALGVGICRPDGRTVAEVAREFVPHDVAPQETLEIETRFRLPWLEAGDYLMRFDMLSERLGWFQQFGSTPESKALNVVAASPTSARPRLARAEIAAAGLPESARPGDEIVLHAGLRNVGDTLWLAASTPEGGAVALGLVVRSSDGSEVTDLVRAFLPRDVAPGEEISIERRFLLPWLDPGSYWIDMDLVAERIGWFREFGSTLVTRPLLVQPGPLTSACPRILRAEISLGELPAHVRPGEEMRVRARVRNTGDTLWLSAPRELGGRVSFGLKLVSSDGHLVVDALGRTAIPRDVPPGEEVEVESVFEVPPGLEPGGYRLRFDMVDEQIAWFEQLDSPVVERTLTVRP